MDLLMHLCSDVEIFRKRLENLPEEDIFSGTFFTVLWKLIGVLRRIFLSFWRSPSLIIQWGLDISFGGFLILVTDFFDDF